MSSFRPTVRSDAVGFEPRPIAMLGGRDFSHRDLVETRENEGEREAAIPSDTADVTDQTRAYTEAEIEALEAAAYERGAAEARLDVEASQRAFAALEQASQAARRELATRPASNREAIVELAAEIATRWVGRELRLDASRVLGLIEAALSEAGEEAPHAVYLNPEDIAALEREASEALDGFRSASAVAIEADASLSRGEFRIDLFRGVVDGRLDAARQDLIDRLAEAFDAPLPAPASETDDGGSA